MEPTFLLHPALMKKLITDRNTQRRRAVAVMRWLQLRFDLDSTAIQPPSDSHLTEARPRYDYSTTFVMTVGTAA